MNLRKIVARPDIHFLLFGGKGGVGKTSCASATGIWAADHGKRTLIVSTDPAHSLADSLDQKLEKGEITDVVNVPNLWALEIDPNSKDEEMTDFLSQSSSEFAPMLMDMGGLTPPGSDEAMAFGKVLEFLQSTDYDLIIFDTAPTGHTLRLLSIPDLLSSWMGKMLKFRLKMGKMLSGFKSLFSGGAGSPDGDALENLEKMKSAIEAAKDELSNPDKTSFVIVLIPEIMAIYESERLLKSLMEYEINSEYMIINHLIPENTNCDFCKSRRLMQQKHLDEIRVMYGEDFQLVEVDEFSGEIRKTDVLRKLGTKLCGP